MMDINWTVRINNPIWWWQVFLAVFTPLLNDGYKLDGQNK